MEGALTVSFDPADCAFDADPRLYTMSIAAQLPGAITAAHVGDRTPVATLGAAFALAVGGQFSFGMTLSVLCAEDAPGFGPAGVERIDDACLSAVVRPPFAGVRGPGR